MRVHGATVVLSALLLFLVQPIVAKYILPWFGGTAAVWTTCLVFFQGMLLAGYAYAHFTTLRVPRRWQAGLHLLLLVASLAALPIIPGDWLKPTSDVDEAGRIVLLLALTVGLPYLLLASTGPLLQAWMSEQFAARSVYRLFAWSNLGSLLGLLLFPLAVEPAFSSSVQAYVWSAAYIMFVALCGTVAAQRWKAPALESTQSTSGTVQVAGHAAPPGAADYFLWTLLAALGTGLLLATTNHITQNVAPVPLLWVVPLALYLLSFVVTFEGRGGAGWYSRRFNLPVTVLFAVAMSFGLTAVYGNLDARLSILLYAVGMFVACWFCHGELAQRKPDSEYLTRFYLTISGGGVLGGMFVALGAPRLFNSYLELPLLLLLLCALAVWIAMTDHAQARAVRSRSIVSAGLGVVATGIQGFAYHEVMEQGALHAERNFYGTVRVLQVELDDRTERSLFHGTILHGKQVLGSAKPEPTAYFTESSGIARAIRAQQARGAVHVGVVGLGIGTVCYYGREGDVFQFYELDPKVVSVAREYFDFIGRCEAETDIVVGDGRTSLESGAGPFDLLALDAFSSDSIPVHLLTLEAIRLYASKIDRNGILAMNITNRFLDVGPVLARAASEVSLEAWLVRDRPKGPLATRSNWVVMGRSVDPKTLESPTNVVTPLTVQHDAPRWTDQFSSLIGVIRSRPVLELDDLRG